MNERGLWESRYAASENLFGTQPSPLLTAHRHLLRPGMSALALGDGEGRNGVWLAEQGLEVLSLDLSPTAQSRARAYAQERGVVIRTVCADLLEWDWPATSFDLITLIFVHLPPADRSRVHRAIIEALRPGGLVMIEAFRREQLEFGTLGPSDPEMLYSFELLQRDFAGFDILTHEEPLTEVIRDGTCLGQGAAIHFVARR